MQLTRFTDLGLRVVMLLATIGDDEAPSTRQLADQLNVSYTHATKVTARLAELAVVSTRRGRGGGLAITELGRTATVGWLARRLEGPGEVIQCEGDAPCPLGATAAAHPASPGAGGLLRRPRRADPGRTGRTTNARGVAQSDPSLHEAV